MIFTDEELGEILVKGAYVTQDDLTKAVEFSKAHRSTIVEYLTREQLINKNILGQAIAESLGMSYVDMAIINPSKEMVELIPEEIARDTKSVVISKTDKEIKIATASRNIEEVKNKLATVTNGLQLTLAYVFEDELERVFNQYRKSLQVRFVSIIQKEKHIAPEILNEIMSDARMFHASDIHLEPLEKEVRIRFRIDGVLHEAGTISLEHYDSILNRIKVQANLRIDEHAKTQDGAIRLVFEGNSVDVRVSLIPTLHGEKVALRLLSDYVRGFTLNDLGLTNRNRDLLVTAIKKPFGMILVVGPTGSGKSTTLYSLLKILHTPEVNITTIEDPVEYKIEGINQIQVNPEANITFADGLRSIARQDPDVILVGEIRDVETSQIAVNAALTGHLMLSTFHANDSATAIPRLLDMGVEPFLVSSALELVIAQRLLRTLCTQCRYSYAQKIEELEDRIPSAQKYFPEKTVTMYRAKGCDHCKNTGYRGRTALFEFIHNTTEMQDLILSNPSIKQIWELARKDGSVSMFEDGLLKVQTGETSIEEVLRIAPPPELMKTKNGK